MIMLFLFQIVVAGIISFLMYRKTSNIDTENQSEIKDLACFVSSIRFYNLDNASLTIYLSILSLKEVI